MELAARGPWRGQGIARRLHATLLDGIRAERVLLNVHPGSEAATAAYRAWGYRKAGEARPWGTGADLHDVMLLDLGGSGGMSAHMAAQCGGGGAGRERLSAPMAVPVFPVAGPAPTSRLR